MKDTEIKKVIIYQSNFFFKLIKITIFLSSILISVYLYINIDKMPQGFKFLFLIPFIFGMYFTFSNLKYYILKNIAISFFIIVLIFRYLITPLLMGLSNEYSAMFNGVTTSLHQQNVAISLMIYEMIAIFITIEICIRLLSNKKHESITSETIYYANPNTVLVISICIGLSGLVWFPNLLDGFNFLFVNSEISISNKNTIAVLFSYFLGFIQVFLFIIYIKYCLHKKSKKRRYSTILILLFSFVNISFMWTANRMTIFIVAGTTLAILLMSFPEKKKIFFVSLISISIFMVILLSGYRLFGTTGSNVNSDEFSDYSSLENLSVQMQIYFAGQDSIAGAVAVNDYYNEIITLKTFLNDSFTSVIFVGQLPFFLNDRLNTTNNFFNITCAKSFCGLIIPMIGQGYLYFGFLLSPLFSVICVIILFLSDRKVNYVTDIGFKYVFVYLTFNFALFPMYNYTIIMQNVFGRIIPLFLIFWINQYVFLKNKPISSSTLTSHNDF